MDFFFPKRACSQRVAFQRPRALSPPHRGVPTAGRFQAALVTHTAEATAPCRRQKEGKIPIKGETRQPRALQKRGRRRGERGDSAPSEAVRAGGHRQGGYSRALSRSTAHRDGRRTPDRPPDPAERCGEHFGIRVSHGIHTSKSKKINFPPGRAPRDRPAAAEGRGAPGRGDAGRLGEGTRGATLPTARGMPWERGRAQDAARASCKGRGHRSHNAERKIQRKSSEK